METGTLQNAPDLRTGFPRSPNEMLGNFVLLARIIDKCRAVIAGTNGEYNYNCPLDRQFFDFASVDAEAFRDQVAAGKNDTELLAWVMEHGRLLNETEIRAWSYKQRHRQPETDEMMAYFESLRQQVAPRRYDVRTWFQLLDAEEGR